MKVEESCPSWKASLKNLREAFRVEQIKAEIQLVLIENDRLTKTA